MNEQDLSDIAQQLPMYRVSPEFKQGVQVTRYGEKHIFAVRFFFYRDVLDELSFAAQYHQKFWIALLTGQFGVEKKHGPFIEVTGFESVHLSDSPDDWIKYIRKDLDSHMIQQNQDPQWNRHVVGFFANMPGTNAYLDEKLAKLHLSLFNIPYQILMMSDSEQESIACYARPPGEAFFNASFSVVKSFENDISADEHEDMLMADPFFKEES